MSEITSECNKDLHDVVVELGHALAASERRTARLERTIRWGALGVLGILALALTALVEPLGTAVAQQGASPSKSVEEALDRINANLTGPTSTLGMMGQMMYAGINAAVGEAQTALASDNTISPLYGLAYDSLRAHLEHQGVPPDQIDIEKIKAIPPQEKGQVLQGAIVAATGSVLVDAGVLMHRVREDSDLFRSVVESMGGPNELLRGIKTELHAMNLALASVPMMAVQMDRMNRNMSVMSHGVGSTMGRMGSWMPW
jgi:type IV secretory pathway VirB2 component (pilin)